VDSAFNSLGDIDKGSISRVEPSVKFYRVPSIENYWPFLQSSNS